MIWLELPKGCDSISLFREAVKQRVSVTPGQLFSANGKFRRCIRLSYGLPWNDKVEEGLKTLGQLVQAQCKKVAA